MLLVFPVFLRAQGVREIVKKHNEAIGGKEKWAGITSMRKEGNIVIMGMAMPVTYTILKGKGMRQDFTVMGTANYMIVTPGGGWTYLPAQGNKAPQPMSADELKAAAGLQLDFQDALMQADAKQWKIILDGEEELKGVRCFKLAVTDNEGAVVTHYVSAKDWYLMRSVKPPVQAEDGTLIELVTDYSDHRRLPAGIVVPFTEDNGDVGATSFTTIETNTVKDEVLFKP